MTWKCCPHYWPFVRGIHWLLVDSSHKRPAMQTFEVFYAISLNKPFSGQQFQMHFLELKCMDLIKISLKFVPKGPINNIPALVQMMATSHYLNQWWVDYWCICITRPQWVRYHHRGCLNNRIFSNLGLCAACWACFMCNHELWPVSVSRSFFSLSSSLGQAGGKHYQEITIPIFRLVLQNFPLSGCFPYILFYHYIFSLIFSGWFVIAACGSEVNCNL